jgi:hypothetical protein
VSGMIINIGGEAGKKLDAGETVLLAIVFYNAKEDHLHFMFPDGADKEEKWAVLQKFLHVPDELVGS